MMSQTAKIFINGRSQAVRLPAEYRFDTKEMFIRKDEATGDVILSSKPADWSDFLELLAASNVSADFLDSN
ncbi:antitoxin [Methylophilus sp. 13]|uniref:antitoxin n=1 Tax=Methylophilus sp. 13 TaxID=2781018 RepID=UPI001E29416A|nr:AbrB/MazE/SpoVT family DNA-binding domain-containing protein [Methylophilus sp. 13]